MLNSSYTPSEVGEALLNLASNIPVNKMFSLGTLEAADGSVVLKLAVADCKTLVVSQTDFDAKAFDDRTDEQNSEIVGRAVSTLVDALFKKNEEWARDEEAAANPAENN